MSQLASKWFPVVPPRTEIDHGKTILGPTTTSSTSVAGIGWEMFNSTDEDMEVLINVPTDSYLSQGGTILVCW
jgi:hypothetical protein